MSAAANYVSIPNLMLVVGGFFAGALVFGSLGYDRYELMNAESKESEAIVWRLDKKTGGINFCVYVDVNNNIYCGKVEHPSE